ncbi:hypothetical protein [Streptomyces sp. NPDC017448]|uniref:hypothetical protein n=1 Tax=Streptomyces sp. NPDC017448 TaxID=3364996 RepID=UPI0037BD5120
MTDFRIRVALDESGQQDIDNGKFSDVEELAAETKEKTNSGEWGCYNLLIEKAVLGGWEVIESLGCSVHKGGLEGTYGSPKEISDDDLRASVNDLWEPAIIEHAPQVVTLPLGLAVGLDKAYDIELGVIGFIAKSNTGNAVLHVGNHQTGTSGWHKVSHVVLTPAEREKLIAELIAQR